MPVSVPEVGTQLGSYRIDELLGRGGMGVVFCATDLRLGRRVALKLLAPHLTNDERFRTRFLAESRLAASIDHAGIVPIYEAGEVEGQLYIAMRYVEGTDLAALLQRDGRLTPARALGLVGQLAEALDDAHARGLLHRDVKPSNALIAAEGGAEHVYLADFGLTSHVADGGATAGGEIAGTIGYVAPECIRGEPGDGRADLYSLGCVLFECLTGDVPFPRDSEVAAIYAHLEEDAPRPTERAPGLPASLDGVVARALAKDPADRFQTGAELVGAARAALPGGPRPAPSRLRGRRRPPPRRALLAVALVAAVATLAVLLLSAGDKRALAIPDTDAVAVIDPARSSLLASVRVGASPSALASGPGAMWVANADDGTVSRVDLRTRTVTQTIVVGSGPGALAVGAGGVWVVNTLDGTMSWISPATDQVVDRIPVGNGPNGVCVAEGAVWVAVSYDRAIVRFDPATRRTTTTEIGDPPTKLACGGGSVWASSESAGSVTQLSARSGDVVHHFETGGGSSGLAFGDGALWVANTRDNTVSRIDAARGVQAVIPVGARNGPASVAVGADGVWVSNELAGTVARIDPRRGAVVQTLKLGNRPQGLAIVDGSLWVGVEASGARHRGGTLRVLVPRPVLTIPNETLDPAFSYTPEAAQILGLVNDGLVTFRRAGGRPGATVLPDLATSVPTPTDRGRTYAFRLRRGIRYSNGAPVRASHFREQLERVLYHGVAPPSFYGGIRGAAACRPKKPGCDLSRGIETDDAAGTLAFHLVRADPDFPYKLAQFFAVPVPPGTGVALRPQPLATTGPYRIASLDENGLRLVRNPHFRPTAGRPEGYADVITYTFRVPRAEALRSVQQGRADIVGGSALIGASRAELDRITTRYAGQLRVDVQQLTFFMWLNTHVAPFDRVDARRALSYAIDRGATVDVLGGDRFAQPTCQSLPPNFPGYVPYCPYTAGAGRAGRRPWSAPDLARARSLVTRSGTRGMRVQVHSLDEGYFAAQARRTRDALERIGYRATVRVWPGDQYWTRAGAAGSRAQLGPVWWLADYPAASNFFEATFRCPPPPEPNGFCDPVADRLMKHARRLEASGRPSDAAWARVDRRIVDQAPYIPLTNFKAPYLVSRRVGNYQYSQQWGVLLDQLWVR